MKKLIHIDNYESFYLDYLEGTLSESERAEFEEFLAAHPELQVDEELLILDDAPELMDALEKELLKKEERSISQDNLDYFAIGKVEQVLSPREEDLLNAYLLAHPEAKKVIEAYQQTRLEAQTVLYAKKEELKEKEIAFISWRFIAGIASAAAVLLLFFQLGMGGKDPQPAVAQTGNKQNNKPEVPNKSNKQDGEYFMPSTNPVEEHNTFVAQKTKPGSTTGSGNNSNQNEQNSEEKIPFQQEQDRNLAEKNAPQPHHPTILPEVKDNKQPVAPTLNEDLHTAPSKDLASHSSSSSNMKNPIPLITNTISEKTKTPVDFKTGKATETEKGGFFIKIGKFEVSHKSSKKK
ncbi:hypothetical protein D3C87_181770 [compost metagenome]